MKVSYGRLRTRLDLVRGGGSLGRLSARASGADRSAGGGGCCVLSEAQSWRLCPRPLRCARVSSSVAASELRFLDSSLALPTAAPSALAARRPSSLVPRSRLSRVIDRRSRSISCATIFPRRRPAFLSRRSTDVERRVIAASARKTTKQQIS